MVRKKRRDQCESSRLKKAVASRPCLVVSTMATASGRLVWGWVIGVGEFCAGRCSYHWRGQAGGPRWMGWDCCCCCAHFLQYVRLRRRLTLCMRCACSCNLKLLLSSLPALSIVITAAKRGNGSYRVLPNQSRNCNGNHEDVSDQRQCIQLYLSDLLSATLYPLARLTLFDSSCVLDSPHIVSTSLHFRSILWIVTHNCCADHLIRRRLLAPDQIAHLFQPPASA
jgi:hypothetical protein